MKRTFPSYKYANPNRYDEDSGNEFLNLFFFLPITAIVIMYFNVDEFAGNHIFLSIVIIVASIAIHSSIKQASKKIVIGNRFFIEGNTIIYYKNLDQLVINYKDGVLDFITKTTKIHIYKKHFPTESNKSHKIAISQNKKFNAIAQKVSHKVKRDFPSVNIKYIEE